MIYDATKSPRSGGGPELITAGVVKNQEPFKRKPILFICTNLPDYYFGPFFFEAIAIDLFQFLAFHVFARCTNGFVANPLFPYSPTTGSFKTRPYYTRATKPLLSYSSSFTDMCLLVSFVDDSFVETNLTEDTAATLGLTGSHGGNGGGVLSTHALGLGANTGDVGLAGDVPHGDVLLHAAGQAGVLLGRKGRARGRDASLEAVLVDFLGAG